MDPWQAERDKITHAIRDIRLEILTVSHERESRSPAKDARLHKGVLDPNMCIDYDTIVKEGYPFTF